MEMSNALDVDDPIARPATVDDLKNKYNAKRNASAGAVPNVVCERTEKGSPKTNTWQGGDSTCKAYLEAVPASYREVSSDTNV